MLVRGGIFGVHRIARHLWRMCFALFIASGSIFIARPQIFPAILSRTHTLLVLSILPLILMILWLFRVRFTNTYKEEVDAARKRGLLLTGLAARGETDSLTVAARLPYGFYRTVTVRERRSRTSATGC